MIYIAIMVGLSIGFFIGRHIAKANAPSKGCSNPVAAEQKCGICGGASPVCSACMGGKIVEQLDEREIAYRKQYGKPSRYYEDGGARP